MTHHPSHIPVIQNTTVDTAAENITAHQATTLQTTLDQAHDYPTSPQNTGHTKRDQAVQYHIPTTETTSPI